MLIPDDYIHSVITESISRVPTEPFYKDTPLSKHSSKFDMEVERYSRGNRGYRNLGHGDVGSMFLLERDTYSDDVEYYNTEGLGIYWSRGYEYPFVNSLSAGARAYGTVASPFGDLAISALFAKGATAISRCTPTRPHVDSLVALAELAREGIPKISGSALLSESKKFRALGSEYLNVEFGWKPFVADLRKLAATVMASDRILKSLTDGSGKVLHREYRFPAVESETMSVVSGAVPAPALLTQFYTSFRGTREVISRQSTEAWFSGSFSYYLDLKSTSSWEAVSAAAKKARLLYGIKLTPDVVWNLIPWTWLVDWGANIGDVLANVGNFSNDGLVMRYGYMMKHDRVSTQYRLHGIRMRYMAHDLGLSQTLGHESKMRVKASPFGFGLDFDGFDARQMSILAALGITKVL